MTDLLIQRENAEKETLRLREEAVVIGRDPANRLYLNDGRASRRHAELRPENGAWVLRDLGSSNGTWLNGAELTGEARLSPGDRIGVGRTTIVFNPNGAAARRGSPDSSFITGSPDETQVLTVPLSDTASDLTGLRFDEQSAKLVDDPTARLQMLMHYAERLRSCYKLDELAEVLLDAMFELVEPDRAALLLKDPDSGDEMKPWATRSNLPGMAAKDPVRISHSIVDRCISERSTAVVTDTSMDDQLRDAQSVVLDRIGSVICCPLISGDEVYGALYMDILMRSAEIRRPVLELLGGVASQAALAVGNCLNHRHELRNRELSLQLDLAHRIHDRLLPGEHFEMGPLRIAAVNRPSSRVGGDYYGFFETERGPLLTISDSTGHGVSAALIMTTARAYLRAMLQTMSGRPLQDVLVRLNRLLCGDLENGLFVTQVLVRVEDQGRKLHYCMAGHEPPLLYRPETDEFIELSTGGVVLGLMKDCPYDEAAPVDLEPGDRLVLFTDGIVEQDNSKGEEFGLEKLKDSLRRHAKLPVRECLSAMLEDVEAWRGDTEQEDDLTLVVAENAVEK